MAQAVPLSQLGISESEVLDVPRHSVAIRVTHWLTTLSFLVLLLSGIAILLAHPRLYWGETGAVGGPSLIDLPLPFVLEVPIRGPGRYLHFTFGWLLVVTGLFYVLYGVVRGTFRMAQYNYVQRMVYLGVVFVLFPLMIWTGLAMSPTVTSVFPWLATSLGGQQSARTIHFFTTVAIVLFFVVHIVMVIRHARTWAMIKGRI
jgi:thiosulfate reductase cytochrome b subunit